MKFPELVIHNFMGITDATINMADRGLVAVHGINHADTSANSNGTSKSSIPDALCWCWYGTTARGETGDDIINNLVGKDCFVQSVAVDGDYTYTATRYRKHKVHKNSLRITVHDGTSEVDLTKGTDKLTQEVAQQILGCSLEVFAGSIYAGQDNMPDLPAMTDKNLKLLIEEAAGTLVLESAYKKAREDAAAALASMNAVAITREKQEQLISLLRGQASGIDVQIATWDVNRGERLESVNVQIRAIIPQLKQIKEDIDAFGAADIEAKIAEIDKRIAAVGTEQMKMAELERELANANASLTAIKREIDMHRAATERAEKEVAAIEHQVGCPCASCGRPLTDAELGAAKKAKEENVTAYVKAHDDAVSRRAAQEIVVNSALSARDAFKLTLTDVSAESAERASLSSELTSYNAMLARQTLITTQAKNLRDQVTAITAEINPYIAQKTDLEKRINDAEETLKAIEASYLEEEAAYSIEQEVVKVFAPSGVRAHILDEVTPFLNAQTAKYLSTMSDGNMEATWSTLQPDSKGALKEKFAITVTNETGGGKFGLLSGGEKRKARIATALALQDLVSTRASKPIELFIGDEIDDALDAAGLERLMMILEDKAKERGSVFIISHNELRDHIRQVLTIEKHEDRTTTITETTA